MLLVQICVVSGSVFRSPRNRYSLKTDSFPVERRAICYKGVNCIAHFCHPSPHFRPIFLPCPFGIPFPAVFPHFPAVSSYFLGVIPQWPAMSHHCHAMSLPCCVAVFSACHLPPFVIPPRVTPLAGITIYMIIPGHGPILNPGHTLLVGPSLTLTTPSTWAHVQLAVHYGQLSALAGHMIRTN